MYSYLNTQIIDENYPIGIGFGSKKNMLIK